jgi:ABC-type nitrate/sulfonate/bicarbonate transport system substrate-binding protein
MAHYRIGILAAAVFTAWVAFQHSIEIYAAAAVPKVIISFAGVNPRQTPLWIAQEQRLFAKHGVDADVVFIRTGPIQVAAVSSGATQLAYSGPASVLGAAAGGTDLRLMASTMALSRAG